MGAQRKVVLLCLRGPDSFLEEVRETVPKYAAEELEEERAAEEACGVTCAPMGVYGHWRELRLEKPHGKGLPV